MWRCLKSRMSPDSPTLFFVIAALMLLDIDPFKRVNDSLLGAAAAAMYRARQGGRKRVEVIAHAPPAAAASPLASAA